MLMKLGQTLLQTADKLVDGRPSPTMTVEREWLISLSRTAMDQVRRDPDLRELACRPGLLPGLDPGITPG